MTLPTASPPEAAQIARCPHCEAPVEGPDDRFCCHGCEAAHALLHDLGLDDWYDQRASPGNRPELTQHAWEAIETVPDGDKQCTTLSIDGLRCSSCTWVVERVLERTEGVTAAHVSYASGRASVTFDPESVSLRQLAERIARLGYRPRPTSAAAAPDPLFTHLGVALFCTTNLMLLTAGLYASWADGMEPRFQVLFRWLALLLATPIAISSAEPFWRGAWTGLRERRIGMDVPIALAVGVLYAHGLAQTWLGGEAYLDSLGMLVTLLLVGRILEARGRTATADAAAAIAAHLPQTARRRTPHGVEDVQPSDLLVGDVLELGPGTDLAADARVLDGALQVQTALLTGETRPRTSGVGDLLLAGTTILQGSGSASVERTGRNTTAMQMADAVREAIDRPTQDNPASALAPVFTLSTLLVAIVAGGAWTALHSLSTGIEVAVAVLVVACPCALGLSVPLGLSSGLGALARRGVLLRNGDALDRLADVQTLAFDKTGTVTVGEPLVLDADDATLRIAAGLERGSSHPIARALTRAAVERGIPLPFPTEVVETAGIGIEGTLDGARWALRAGEPGSVLLSRNGVSFGTLQLGDLARPDARQSLKALEGLGLSATLLSGDDASTTTRMAMQLGVTGHGGLLPDDKAAWIATHPAVLFVGDGLNDGSALATAHVGLAMQDGAGTALGVADGIIAGDGLAPVVAAVRGARATRRAIRNNLRRSLVYNVVAVAAAALGFVNPLVAAVLMPISSGMVLLGTRSIERTLRNA